MAEIAVQTARASGERDAVHVEGLGATAIAFKALEDGAIDLYPDYTGTVAESVFHGAAPATPDALSSELEKRGLGMIVPLGFENIYALAVRGPAALFNAAKPVVVLGMGLGFLLWFTGFAVIGGEWFAMWQSKEWNGVPSAFRFYVTLLLVLIFVMQPDSDAES